MKIVEFRIPLPVNLDEYQRCCIYLVIEASLKEMESGSGFEVLKNEECIVDGKSGRYTEKRFHLARNLPNWLRSILGDKLTVLTEKSWNIYPSSVTKYSNEVLSSIEFSIQTENKEGLEFDENVMNLSPKDLKQRNVVFIDITKYHKSKAYDVTIFKSENHTQFPLSEGWYLDKGSKGIITYKLVRLNLPYFGLLAPKIENFVISVLQDKLILYLSSAMCWIDKWYDLTFEYLRTAEIDCYNKLNEKFYETYNISKPWNTAENVEVANDMSPRSSLEIFAVDTNADVAIDEEGKEFGPTSLEFSGPIVIPSFDRDDEFQDAFENIDELLTYESIHGDSSIEEDDDNRNINTMGKDNKLLNDVPVVFTGYLLKLGCGFSSWNWNLRYIIICGVNLYYFNHKNDIKPKDVINLKDSRINWVGPYMNRPYVFSITTQDKITYYWSADAQESVKRWILLLQVLCEEAPTSIIKQFASEWDYHQNDVNIE